MTVLGFGGVFAVFTYIQPILTELAGFSKEAVSPILLVFGAGLVGGNLVGGRWADKALAPALLGSLAILTVVLVASAFGFHDRIGAVVAAFGLGAAAFATVAPLQMRVLSQAGGAGQGLASSLNIAAFNLGNAFGAWLGGAVIAHGPGLAAVPLVAAAVPLSALALAAFSLAVGVEDVVLEEGPPGVAPLGRQAADIAQGVDEGVERLGHHDLIRVPPVVHQHVQRPERLDVMPP
jgi:DHA1 family inner membrane transport protein